MTKLGRFAPYGDKLHVTWYNVPRDVLIYLGSHAKNNGWLAKGQYVVSGGSLFIDPAIKHEFIEKAHTFYRETQPKVETSNDLKPEQLKLF